MPLRVARCLRPPAPRRVIAASDLIVYYKA